MVDLGYDFADVCYLGPDLGGDFGDLALLWVVIWLVILMISVICGRFGL